MNTSPITVSCFLKPPAVPALITRSGFNVCPSAEQGAGAARGERRESPQETAIFVEVFVCAGCDSCCFLCFLVRDWNMIRWVLYPERVGILLCKNTRRCFHAYPALLLHAVIYSIVPAVVCVFFFFFWPVGGGKRSRPCRMVANAELAAVPSPHGLPFALSTASITIVRGRY